MSVRYETDSFGVKTAIFSTTATTATLTSGVVTTASLDGSTKAVVEGYTIIGASAFNISSLTTVTLSQSITSIGANAFDTCINLTSIVITNSATTIGANAFANCNNLTTATIPAGANFTVVSGVKNFFYGCTSITDITLADGLTEVSDNRFLSCVRLVSVKIPSSVTKIGASSFDGCGSMKYFIIAQNSKLTTLSYRSFNECGLLTSIELPEGLTGSGDHLNGFSEAFRNCISLSSVTFPKTLLSIGRTMFADCTGLTSINIRNSLTTIGEDSFINCNFLTTATIPAGANFTVVSGVRNFFYGCTSITDITLADGLTEVPDTRFQSCSKLVSVTIPASVTRIGVNSFAGCGSMKYFIIAQNSKLTTLSYRSFHACGLLTSIALPEGLTSSGNEATYGTSETFNNCIGLVSVTLPTTLTTIGATMFSGCTALTYVNIPYGVTTIGERAFTGCTALASIDIANSVTTISSTAFTNCTALRNVTIPDMAVFTTGADNSKSVFYGAPGITNITLRDGLTNVPSGRFNGYGKILSVTIPSTVITIESYAFASCMKLTTFVIPTNSTLNAIKEFGFYNCGELTSIALPETLQMLGNTCFYYCIKLPTINLPRNMLTIGGDAFYNCTQLTSIRISNSVTTIGDGAFSSTGIKTIYMNSGNKFGITSPQSNVSFKGATGVTITPYPLLTAPLNVTAARGNASAFVMWNPASNPVDTQFIVKWNNGASSQTSVSSTSATITGLTNGQSYTFTVVAKNALGDSYSSTASNSVTPITWYNITFPIITIVSRPDGYLVINKSTASTYSETSVRFL